MAVPTNLPLQAENPYNPNDSRGPCDKDVRLNFNLGGTYTVPKFSALGRFGEGMGNWYRLHGAHGSSLDASRALFGPFRTGPSRFTRGLPGIRRNTTFPSSHS